MIPMLMCAQACAWAVLAHDTRRLSGPVTCLCVTTLTKEQQTPSARPLRAIREAQKILPNEGLDQPERYKVVSHATFLELQ